MNLPFLAIAGIAEMLEAQPPSPPFGVPEAESLMRDARSFNGRYWPSRASPVDMAWDASYASLRSAANWPTPSDPP